MFTVGESHLEKLLMLNVPNMMQHTKTVRVRGYWNVQEMCDINHINFQVECV